MQFNGRFWGENQQLLLIDDTSNDSIQFILHIICILLYIIICKKNLVFALDLGWNPRKSENGHISKTPFLAYYQDFSLLRGRMQVAFSNILIILCTMHVMMPSFQKTSVNHLMKIAFQILCFWHFNKLHIAVSHENKDQSNISTHHVKARQKLAISPYGSFFASCHRSSVMGPKPFFGVSRINLRLPEFKSIFSGNRHMLG